MNVERLINAVRDAHPDNEEIYLRGRCYNFFLILRSVRPDAVAYYSRVEGHVYTMIDGSFYDIRGKRLCLPEDLRPLDHQTGDRPHRWAKRDRRRFAA